MRRFVALGMMLFAMLPAPVLSAPLCMEGAGEQIVYDGRSYASSDKVRIASRAGTFKPAETGHFEEVEAAAGKTGAIHCFAASPVTGRAELAVVDWDSQEWQIWRSSTGLSQDKVTLRGFRASVHLSYLRRGN